MQFYTRQHQFSCGVNLHAPSRHVLGLDQDGDMMVSKDIPRHPNRFYS